MVYTGIQHNVLELKQKTTKQQTTLSKDKLVAIRDVALVQIKYIDNRLALRFKGFYLVVDHEHSTVVDHEHGTY